MSNKSITRVFIIGVLILIAFNLFAYYLFFSMKEYNEVYTDQIEYITK